MQQKEWEYRTSMQIIMCKIFDWLLIKFNRRLRHHILQEISISQPRLLIFILFLVIFFKTKERIDELIICNDMLSSLEFGRRDFALLFLLMAYLFSIQCLLSFSTLHILCSWLCSNSIILHFAHSLLSQNLIILVLLLVLNQKYLFFELIQASLDSFSPLMAILEISRVKRYFFSFYFEWKADLTFHKQ